MQIGEWGVLGDPNLGVDFYRGVRGGGDARTLGHSVRANKDGTRAYLSYWDAGVIILDISDPTNPGFVGRTAFAPGEEGNAHSVTEVRGGNMVVQADEDFSPSELTFTSNAFEGSRAATEAVFTPKLVEMAGYSDGVRVIDISQPASPREIGLWIGEGAPADAPAVDIWSVVPHGDLL